MRIRIGRTVCGCSALAILCVLTSGRALAGSEREAVQGAVVCIDPGHPSESGRGATGRLITEIKAAWQVAGRLKSLLEDEGARVVLTKDRPDEFVTNRQRARIANGETSHGPGARLLVRLHCDSGSGSGFAVYYPDRQGRVRGMVGPSPEIIAASARAAERFHTAMVKSLAGILNDRGLFPDTKTRIGGRQGALTGSIYSRTPVVLVEMCVLSSARDDRFIAGPEGQNMMARALRNGVMAALEARGLAQF